MTVSVKPTEQEMQEKARRESESAASAEGSLSDGSNIFDHPGGAIGWLKDLCNDTKGIEETRRWEAEKNKKEAKKFADALMRIDSLAEESQFGRELNEWADSGKITDDDFFKVSKKQSEITNQMHAQGELTDKQILDYMDTAEVEPLVEAMRRDLPAKAFLELMKSAGPGKLAEAIRQYCQTL
jgi:hypothetical protein